MIGFNFRQSTPGRSIAGRLGALSLVLSLALALGACDGGGRGKRPSSADKGAKPQEEEAAKPRGPIKVGMDAAYRPMEFVNVDTGQIVGFDVDLIRAVCEEAGLGEPEIQNVPWDGLFASLQNGNLDLAISSITITEERKETLAFSAPYYRSAQALVTRAEDKDKLATLADLKGKTVGVQIATTGQFLLEKEGGIELRRFETAPLAIQDLKNHNLDAAMIDLPVARYHAKASGSDGGAALNVREGGFSEEYYGIAVRKDDSELLIKLNEGLKKAKEKGLVDQLKKKWF
jgi:polar amino acid transport system substrate-binding protein